MPLADISERQGISLSYLEQLFARLRKHGLVSSVRGPGGGYRLGLAPGEISVGQVITAVDESVDATKCLGKGGCHGGTQCLTHSLWRDLTSASPASWGISPWPSWLVRPMCAVSPASKMNK